MQTCTESFLTIIYTSFEKKILKLIQPFYKGKEGIEPFKGIEKIFCIWFCKSTNKKERNVPSLIFHNIYIISKLN